MGSVIALAVSAWVTCVLFNDGVWFLISVLQPFCSVSFGSMSDVFFDGVSSLPDTFAYIKEFEKIFEPLDEIIAVAAIGTLTLSIAALGLRFIVSPNTRDSLSQFMTRLTCAILVMVFWKYIANAVYSLAMVGSHGMYSIIRANESVSPIFTGIIKAMTRSGEDGGVVSLILNLFFGDSGSDYYHPILGLVLALTFGTKCIQLGMNFLERFMQMMFMAHLGPIIAAFSVFDEKMNLALSWIKQLLIQALNIIICIFFAFLAVGCIYYVINVSI